MKLFPNPEKKIVVEIDSSKFARYPVKTPFIESSEFKTYIKNSLANQGSAERSEAGSYNLEEIISRYVLPFVKKGDIVVICQKIISILQKRIIYKKDVKVGFFANFLSKFVKKTPAGFSVRNPLKMQVAINLAGLPRILFASFCGFICKLVGIPGVFYRVAGHQISQIDGFYGDAYPQYAEFGILGPKNCDEICDKLKQKFGFSFIVADVNDLGGNILGKNRDLRGKEKLILQILKDNPAGQSNQQTPIVIIRKIKKS